MQDYCHKIFVSLESHCMSHKQRQLQFRITAVALLLLIISQALAAAYNKRMNVLFIVCDDLNNRLGCYGQKDVISPNLDKFASESLRFDRAYCQFPVCNPSRSSFLSGLRPESTRILNNYLQLRKMNPQVVTFPECFRNHGYWTASTGKVFHGHKTDDANSWDEKTFFGDLRNPIYEQFKREFEAKHGSIYQKENKKIWDDLIAKPDIQQLVYGQFPAGYCPTDMTDDEHADGKNANQVIKWLEEKSYGDKPFLIACGIHRPHVPFWAPQKYFDMYPLNEINLVNDPASDWDDIPELALWGRYRVFFKNPRCPDNSERKKAQQAYYACITHIDTIVGKILDTVKKQGLWDNTIVIFTSDHGLQLGEHGMWGKVTLFETCDRIPFIMRVPGMTKPGSASPRLIELVDLYPTLAELCNLKTPDNLEGISFVPLLKQPDRPWKKAAFTVVQRGENQEITCKAVRSERWRYSEWNDPEANELYDLKNDPREWHNLAKDPKYADEVKMMRGLLYGGWKKALPDGYN